MGSPGQDWGLSTWHRPPFGGWRRHCSETRQQRGWACSRACGTPPIPSPPHPNPHSHFRLGSGVFSTYCTGPRALSPLWLSSSCCSTSCQAGDRGQRVRPGPAASTPRGPPRAPRTFVDEADVLLVGRRVALLGPCGVWQQHLGPLAVHSVEDEFRERAAGARRGLRRRRRRSWCWTGAAGARGSDAHAASPSLQPGQQGCQGTAGTRPRGRATTALCHPLPIAPQHGGAGRTDRQTGWAPRSQRQRSAIPSPPCSSLGLKVQEGRGWPRGRWQCPRAGPRAQQGHFAFQVSAVPPVKAEGLLQGDGTLARLGAQGSRLGTKVTGKSVPGCTACCSPPRRAGRHTQPLTAMQGTRGGTHECVAPGTRQLLQLCKAWSASGQTPPPHGEGKPRHGGIK